MSIKNHIHNDYQENIVWELITNYVMKYDSTNLSLIILICGVHLNIGLMIMLSRSP